LQTLLPNMRPYGAIDGTCLNGKIGTDETLFGAMELHKVLDHEQSSRMSAASPVSLNAKPIGSIFVAWSRRLRANAGAAQEQRL